MSGDDIRDQLNGRRVLITGASSGIGAAVATRFGAVGAHVCVHYNSNRQGAEAVVAAVTAAGGKAVALQGDLAQRGAATSAIADAARALGGLDVLVNNAGDMLERRALEAVGDDELDRMIDLNVRPTVLACAAAIPLLRQSRGCIINVTSISAHSGSSAGANLYAASKGFLATYTHGLARELAPEQIRVNAVAPGIIDTPLHARRTPAHLYQSFANSIPMARVGTADECVGAFLFLACPLLSGYVTGQIIDVNGGQYMA